MIRHRKDMTTSAQHEMRGGNGDVHFLHLMTPEETAGKMRVIAELSLEKGCSIGRHSHTGEAELFIIKQGVATVDDDGEIVKCYPGDIVYTTNGAFHSLANGEEETLVVYALVIN